MKNTHSNHFYETPSHSSPPFALFGAPKRVHGYFGVSRDPAGHLAFDSEMVALELAFALITALLLREMWRKPYFCMN